MSDNTLIYGKNGLQRIVSLEPTDDGTEVFIQGVDGFVTSEIVPNEYWLLADKCLDQFFKPLKGNLTYKWIKTYKSRRAFSSDRQRLKGEETFSIWNPKEAQMVREGYTYFKSMKHDEVSVLAFDIESTSLEMDRTARVLLISNVYSSQGKTERKLFAYDDYENEGEMLKAWCDWVREKDPTVLTGHNILIYDLPYMAYVADRFGVKLLLGRNDSAIEFDNWKSQFRKDGNTFYEYNKVKVYGREVVDTLFLAYKYDIGRKYENYGLKTIIRQEGLEVANRQFYDAGQIRHKYKDPTEWAKIKSYAEFDADDALALYKLMSPVFFYISQTVARSYQHVIESATGGQINTMMNRAYIQQGHSIPKVTEAVPYEGAISFGVPGIFRNCLKIDVSQMYPSIILQYEVYSKEKDPNAYLLKLTEYFHSKRVEYKHLAKTDKSYEPMEQSTKVVVNSIYGFMGSKFNNFNYNEGAKFITEAGRRILKETIFWASGKQLEEVLHAAHL